MAKLAEFSGEVESSSGKTAAADTLEGKILRSKDTLGHETVTLKLPSGFNESKWVPEGSLAGFLGVRF